MNTQRAADDSVALRSLRLALISPRLPVEGQKRGGIERVANDLASGLAHRGHDVRVWSYDPAPAHAPYRVAPLPFESFTQSWLGHRLTMGYLGNLFSLLPDTSDRDAIITLGDSLLLPLKRRPVVRVMCGSALGEARAATSPWRFLMQSGVYVQELLTAATQPATVGISHNTRRHNPFVRRVIPIGVDLKLFRPDAAERDPHPTILFVGTLGGRKRGGLLLEWFQEMIRPKVPDARLVIVGPAGPPVPGVRYETGISMEELSHWYRRAWVYASPSSYEGFGLPYVEAMASGTPVVATPNPGSREVLDDGRYGALVEDDDFAEAVSELLLDDDRRAKLAASGLDRADLYGLDRMLDSYEELLIEMVANRSPGQAA